MKTIGLSLKSVIFRKKQYLSLVLVCLFGVGISLFFLYLIDGMLGALEYKAKIYYGGDLQLLGESPSLDQASAEPTIERIRSIFPEDTVITRRYDYDADYASFYFEGTGVRQRIIKGIDFNVEQELFRNWSFSAGGVEDMAGSNGILLSEPIAEMLGVKVNDEITFMIRNLNGIIDTRTLIVKGIFKDSSLFGMYTSYMDINFLEEFCAYPVGWCNRICLYFPNQSPSKKDVLHYQTELEKIFKMYPVVENKQIFYDNLWSLEWPSYALIKLSANLQNVQILIDAMKLIAGFVIIMLIIIIVTGVSSTFRVIVFKRINEIGIYKAIGMKRNKIIAILLYETNFLVIIGCILGFGFSILLCALSNNFNLSFIPAFDIFLTNGILTPRISFSYFILFSIAVIVTTSIAVLFAINKAVKVPPCEALAATE